VDKQPGDDVFAGTINGRGALELEVTRVGRDTRLAKIIHLVEVAQAQRAPVQSFVDRFARIYTPGVIVLAVLVAAVPPLAFGAGAGTWFYRALVLLVIACPCALVISTPVSIVAALSAAARAGVLIKGGAYLERLAAVSAVAFDKTGTLTCGEPVVSHVIAAESWSAADLAGYAAAVESRSEHPIAQAIIAYARRHRLAVPPASGFIAATGMGAEAHVLGHTVVIGNAAMLVARAIGVPAEYSHVTQPGASNVFVAIDGRFAGAIAIADPVRETARETIELLRANGIRHVAMLTGDHPGSAAVVAQALGLDEHHAGLLPEQKQDRIVSMRAHGGVLMVGDGVNDAPALAAADIGVAMGAAGSDAALETADVALMSDELLKLPYTLRLARATVRNIKTNVVVSLLLKAVFLVMAITGTATLWMAVLADTGASLIVVANALRLLRTR
jgi:Cd2+/Zn2+-exporting ATPase